jgi:hypothetical protein
MSGSTRNATIVSRDYRPELEYCAHALKLLLKKSVKEGGLAITAPDDRKGPKHDPAKVSISQ